MSFHAKQTGVMFVGFVLGVALAVSIVPGDIFLWIAAGAVLGMFARTFFAETYGGDLMWPLPNRPWFHAKRHDEKRHGLRH